MSPAYVIMGRRKDNPHSETRLAVQQGDSPEDAVRQLRKMGNVHSITSVTEQAPQHQMEPGEKERYEAQRQEKIRKLKAAGARKFRRDNTR